MKTGRPKVFIDENTFENLCRLQCTLNEVCEWFGCSDRTIERWCKKTYRKTFVEVFREKRVGGLVSLRRAQFHLAEKNATMAIWLGKQYLGQKDEKSVEISTNDEVVKDMEAFFADGGAEAISDDD